MQTPPQPTSQSSPSPRGPPPTPAPHGLTSSGPLPSAPHPSAQQRPTHLQPRKTWLLHRTDSASSRSMAAPG